MLRFCDAAIARMLKCLIVWAQLPRAGRAIPRMRLPQQLPTKGRVLGKGSVAAGEELKYVLKAVLPPGKNGF